MRDALNWLERSSPPAPGQEKDVSSEVIAARIAAMDEIVAAMKALPLLDARPIQEIVDDINEI